MTSAVAASKSCLGVSRTSGASQLAMTDARMDSFRPSVSQQPSLAMRLEPRNRASKAPFFRNENGHRRDGREARRRVAERASGVVRSCSAAEPQPRHTDQLSRETQSRIAASRWLTKKSSERRLGNIESMIRLSKHVPCGTNDDTVVRLVFRAFKILQNCCFDQRQVVHFPCGSLL